MDSNLLLDFATSDPRWEPWSTQRISLLANQTRLVINAIIYAEVSVQYDRTEDLDAVLSPNIFEREVIPFEAAFLAGKCFSLYRSRGGVRRSPLPDFFIGAHAAVAGYRLLTRDAARYRTYSRRSNSSHRTGRERRAYAARRGTAPTRTSTLASSPETAQAMTPSTLT